MRFAGWTCTHWKTPPFTAHTLCCRWRSVPVTGRVRQKAVVHSAKSRIDFKVSRFESDKSASSGRDSASRLDRPRPPQEDRTASSNSKSWRIFRIPKSAET